jgi:hypothetical protein
MTRTLNPFYTPEQERMRELVFALSRSEQPLSPADLGVLAPFVKRVREEFVENTTPGQRSIRRVEYFMLNDRGHQFYLQWMRGQLDGLVPLPDGRPRA